MPPWAISDELLRGLLTLFWENRAAGQAKRESGWPNGDASDRLRAAQQKLEKSIPGLETALKRACHEFVQCADPARKQVLMREVQNFDTQLVLIRRGPGVILRLIYGYYRRGLSSSECGAELRLKPQHCRQLLRRLHLFFAKIQKMDKRPGPLT
jgi:hypothetical protein